MNGKLLKLRAEDGDDIQVISAVLQDAIVPLCDMAYNSEDHSFVLVAQRLRRETDQAGEVERICSALTLTGVRTVQMSGVDLAQRDRILDLLALLFDAQQKQLTLIFAGDARLRLELGDWSARIEDYGQPWPALCNPCHDEAARNA